MLDSHGVAAACANSCSRCHGKLKGLAPPLIQGSHWCCCKRLFVSDVQTMGNVLLSAADDLVYWGAKWKSDMENQWAYQYIALNGPQSIFWG